MLGNTECGGERAQEDTHRWDGLRRGGGGGCGKPASSSKVAAETSALLKLAESLARKSEQCYSLTHQTVPSKRTELDCKRRVFEWGSPGCRMSGVFIHLHSLAAVLLHLLPPLFSS